MTPADGYTKFEAADFDVAGKSPLPQAVDVTQNAHQQTAPKETLMLNVTADEFEYIVTALLTLAVELPIEDQNRLRRLASKLMSSVR